MQTSIADPSAGGVATERTITFYPDDTFTSENFVGGMSPDVTVTSEGSSSGTYQIQGNTLTFNFLDEQVRREFFFVFPDQDFGNPDTVRIGGSDYSRE
ncbi:MAG: hypothetical protein ACRCYY_18800 [Trueperaceae bacterium]